MLLTCGIELKVLKYGVLQQLRWGKSLASISYGNEEGRHGRFSGELVVAMKERKKLWLLVGQYFQRRYKKVIRSAGVNGLGSLH